MVIEEDAIEAVCTESSFIYDVKKNRKLFFRLHCNNSAFL